MLAKKKIIEIQIFGMKQGDIREQKATVDLKFKHAASLLRI